MRPVKANIFKNHIITELKEDISCCKMYILVVSSRFENIFKKSWKKQYCYLKILRKRPKFTYYSCFGLGAWQVCLCSVMALFSFQHVYSGFSDQLRLRRSENKGLPMFFLKLCGSLGQNRQKNNRATFALF